MVSPARRAILSTLDRAQRHRAANSFGERYGDADALLVSLERLAFRGMRHSSLDTRRPSLIRCALYRSLNSLYARVSFTSSANSNKAASMLAAPLRAA